MHWYSMNWFDLAIIGIIAISIIVSFFRGLLREMVSLIAWVAAVLLALKFGQYLGEDIAKHFSSPMVRYLIGFFVIFIAVLVVGFIVNVIIKYLIDKVGAGFFDRIFGVVFGAARGLLFVAVVLMFLGVSPMRDATWLQDSQIAPMFEPLVSWLDSFLPKQLKQLSEWVSNSGEQQG